MPHPAFLFFLPRLSKQLMSHPLCSCPITGHSTLLRDAPPLCSASVRGATSGGEIAEDFHRKLWRLCYDPESLNPSLRIISTLPAIKRPAWARPRSIFPKADLSVATIRILSYLAAKFCRRFQTKLDFPVSISIAILSDSFLATMSMRPDFRGTSNSTWEPCSWNRWQ